VTSVHLEDLDISGMYIVAMDHDIHPRGAQILERGVSNYGKRIFLESWHSTMDSSVVNERKGFPRAYIFC